MRFFHCGPYRLSLHRPLVMGIVNLTPDSFSGDGLGGDVERAIAHARAQRQEGADILDIGAESSRPGAMPTPEAEELARLLPVLEEVTTWGLPISVDTYKPAVMRAALAAGAAMINDITAMRQPEARAVAAASACGVCLMHMRGEPLTMQDAPVYADVVGEVREFLQKAVAGCRRAGIADERLLLDPGFGFGKALEHNLTLLRRMDEVTVDGLPLLAGLSRKAMLGAITGRPGGAARLPASVAAALLAANKGARILRVHDVAATRDALAVWSAVQLGETP